ncbi:MAG: hypothetical protein ABFS12_08290 [Bacteroidota bacterium]
MMADSEESKPYVNQRELFTVIKINVGNESPFVSFVFTVLITCGKKRMAPIPAAA